ncbi:MAG: hypothetical protein HYV07_09610 [Deltaproteobacteria bacterium]|nr:hypothetical protein [Deltaproteobacteria bacterium]
MRSARLSVVVLALGCAESPAISIRIPEVSGARSLIVADQTDEKLVALASPPEDYAANSFDVEGKRTLELAWYSEPLDALYLAPGPVAPAPGSSVRTFSELGPPIEIRRLTLTPDTIGEWVIPEAPDVLSKVSFPAPGPCAPLRVTVEDIPAEADVRLSVALEDSILLGTTQSDLLAVTPSASKRLRVELDGRTSTTAWWSGAAIGTELVLVGKDGQVARASLPARRVEGDTLTLETILGRDPSPDRHRPSTVTPVGTSSSAGFLVMFATGGVQLLQNGAWRLIHAFTQPRFEDELGTILDARDGSFFFASSFSSELARWSPPDTLRFERPPTAAGITKLALVEGVGVMAGDAEGALFIREATGTWVATEDSPVKIPTHILFALPTTPEHGAGVLYGGFFGQLGRWFLGLGYCPGEQPVAFSVEEAFFLGGKIVLVGDAPAGGATSVIGRMSIP